MDFCSMVFRNSFPLPLAHTEHSFTALLVLRILLPLFLQFGICPCKGISHSSVLVSATTVPGTDCFQFTS